MKASHWNSHFFWSEINYLYQIAEPTVVRLNVKYIRWLQDDIVVVDINPLTIDINWFGLIIMTHILQSNPGKKKSSLIISVLTAV